MTTESKPISEAEILSKEVNKYIAWCLKTFGQEPTYSDVATFSYDIGFISGEKSKDQALADLQKQIELMNQNCISLSLHESRMAELRKEIK